MQLPIATSLAVFASFAIAASIPVARFVNAMAPHVIQTVGLSQLLTSPEWNQRCERALHSIDIDAQRVDQVIYSIPIDVFSLPLTSSELYDMALCLTFILNTGHNHGHSYLHIPLETGALLAERRTRMKAFYTDLMVRSRDTPNPQFRHVMTKVAPTLGVGDGDLVPVAVEYANQNDIAAWNTIWKDIVVLPIRQSAVFNGLCRQAASNQNAALVKFLALVDEVPLGRRFSILLKESLHTKFIVGISIVFDVLRLKADPTNSKLQAMMIGQVIQEAPNHPVVAEIINVHVPWVSDIDQLALVVDVISFGRSEFMIPLLQAIDPSAQGYPALDLHGLFDALALTSSQVDPMSWYILLDYYQNSPYLLIMRNHGYPLKFENIEQFQETVKHVFFKRQLPKAVADHLDMTDSLYAVVLQISAKVLNLSRIDSVYLDLIKSLKQAPKPFSRE
jgi:hypothetical protein